MQFPNFSSSSSDRRWSFERGAMWALLATLFLATIVVIPSSAIPFVSTKILILAIGAVLTLVLFVLARLTLGNLILPPLSLIGALWLVPLAYGLSTLFSGTPVSLAVFGHAFDSDTFGFMVLISLLGTFAALSIRRIEQYRTFLRAAGLLFGVILVVQIGVLVTGNFAPAMLNPGFSIVGSFSDLALVSGLGLVMMLVVLRFMNVSRATARALGLMGVFALFFLALANDAVTWVLIALISLGLFVEGVMRRTLTTAPETEVDALAFVEGAEGSYAFETLIDTGDSPRANDSGARIAAPLIVLVAALFFLIGGATVAGALGNAVHINNATVRPSWQSTIAVGKDTYHTDALFGSGPDTFGAQLLLYRNASANLTPFWDTDFLSGVGFIPTSFVTTGIIGVLAWLAFLGLFLFFGIRALIARETENSFVRAVAIATFVGMLFVMLELIFNVSGPILLALGLVLAGVFASTLRYFYPEKQRAVSFAQNPRIGFIIVFLLTIVLLASVAVAYVVVGRYMAQTAFLQAQNALASNDLSTAAAAAQQSILFAPTDDAYRLEAVIGIAAINQLVQHASTGSHIDTAKLQAILSQSIAAAQDATRANPDAYQNWIALGSVYNVVVPLNVSGAYSAATKAYQHAAALNPTSPLIPFSLAELAITNKSYKDAETYLTQTVSLKSDYTPAILELAQVEAQLGKASEALKAAEAAAYFIPNNPAILFQVGVLRLETNDVNGAIQALSQAVALNKEYANALYFLAVAYADNGDYSSALKEIDAVAALSSQNAVSVAPARAALAKNTNPFAAHTVGTPLPTTVPKK
ncbi:MAG: hypothetical protein B7X04_04040 [Parcubacteria group bacterium 21-54-25]|nr:MAG: hypothetical protein B7X04_04040 [Parcubacteria group bacterium 21-54-25]HQU08136.1 hypothetical protein [Candidatus Paceibacterota bacterium]